jgi:hypothetical protein
MLTMGLKEEVRNPKLTQVEYVAIYAIRDIFWPIHAPKVSQVVQMNHVVLLVMMRDI